MPVEKKLTTESTEGTEEKHLGVLFGDFFPG